MPVISIASPYPHPRSIPFQRPMEITCFSLDEKRNIHHDDRELKYYKQPSLGQNLSDGFDQFVERDESLLEHLDPLLDSLKNLGDEEAVNVDFVTWRGILTLIAATPYTNESWELRVCRVGNTIYLDQHKEVEKKDFNLKLMCFWGYKFESLCTSSLSVNNNVQYCSVAKSKLGKFTVVFGAEVDCTLDDKIDNDPIRNYIELKTSKELLNERNVYSFRRYKLLKIYLQSFFIGIPRIIIGFRDNNGILKSIETFETLKIPRIVREERLWDPNICLDFLERVFQWLKDSVSSNDRDTVYSVHFKHPFTHISLEKMENGNGFIPDWYFV